MSETVSSVVAAVVAPLSTDVQNAVITAAEAHLASVENDVQRVKAAVTNGLVNVAVASQGYFAKAEKAVVAEAESLGRKVAAMVPTARLGAEVVGGVALVGYLVAHFAFHLF